ncbi:MAG: SAM-dependent methyltransferase [Nitrospirae bacterium]|nr:MAG: SAM-dependent methyltransferase [Nitrospirota bacterium]
MQTRIHRSDSVLVDRIRAEIAEHGPITFARFMELALYDPEHGYYMTGANERARGADAETRLGWEGDFLTAPDVHPLLGMILFRQIREVDALLDHPRPLTVVEIGPGKGTLVRDLLHACSRSDPDLLTRLRYVLVERSPMMRRAQEQMLAPYERRRNHLQWVTAVEELGDRAVTGLIYSNELVDALPIHRVTVRGGALKEIMVDVAGAEFIESLADPSTPELGEYLRRQGITLPEGYTTEIHLEAVRWMKSVAQALDRGLLVTIDYGHTAQDYYAPTRRDGTLLCYSRHRIVRDPYTMIGEQDMTAHVNFSALALAGEEHGASVAGFTNLSHYLIGLGAEELLADGSFDSHDLRRAAELFRPQGFGGTFKVLIQQKGLSAPTLRGLRFRPFFDGVLDVRRSDA